MLTVIESGGMAGQLLGSQVSSQKMLVGSWHVTFCLFSALLEEMGSQQQFVLSDSLCTKFRLPWWLFITLQCFCSCNAWVMSSCPDPSPSLVTTPGRQTLTPLPTCLWWITTRSEWITHLRSDMRCSAVEHVETQCCAVCCQKIVHAPFIDRACYCISCNVYPSDLLVVLQKEWYRIEPELSEFSWDAVYSKNIAWAKSYFLVPSYVQ